MDLQPTHGADVALIKTAFERLQRALAALQEAVQAPMDAQGLLRDATIQRFEFTIELFWKFLKQVLYQTGRDVSLPRQILQEAYRAGWLQDETTWLAMLQARNLTSHTYLESLAVSVHQAICLQYLQALQAAVQALEQVHLPALGLGWHEVR
jgi:nucleotidyltransferase substrate binding protein (TIGR01987 family)